MQDVLLPDLHGVEIKDTPVPADEPGRRDRLAVKAWIGGVDRRGSQVTVGSAEEQHEDGCLGQAANPGLAPGHQPRSIGSGDRECGSPLDGSRREVR